LYHHPPPADADRASAGGTIPDQEGHTMPRIVVTADRHETIERHYNSEDGEWIHRSVHSYLVSFREPYGFEWTLCHAFPDTARGALQASRVAAKVQATLDARGIDGLDDTHWASRIIYGSAAYLDEEPWIVAREKADALISECRG
jgi:hypothetical protein